MNSKMLKAAFAGLVLSVSGFANAGLILSDSTVVDSAGDSYSELFDTTGFSDFQDLIFTVEARGDYGNNGSDEFIEFWMDGTSLGQFSWSTPGSLWGGTGDQSIDWILNFNVTITQAQWSNFSNDNELTISWNNSSEVGLFDSYHTSYVNYELNGTAAEVPEPTTLAILALSIMGLASRRSRLVSNK